MTCLQLTQKTVIKCCLSSEQQQVLLQPVRLQHIHKMVSHRAPKKPKANIWCCTLYKINLFAWTPSFCKEKKHLKIMNSSKEVSMREKVLRIIILKNFDFFFFLTDSLNLEQNDSYNG